MTPADKFANAWDRAVAECQDYLALLRAQREALGEQVRERFALSEQELALVERDPALREFVRTIIALAQSSATALQRARRAVERLSRD